MPLYPSVAGRSGANVIGTWHVLDASAVAVSHTGDTVETTLATVTVPGGAMGANGVLRLTTLWSCTDSANNKTPRIKFGGTGGTQYFGVNLTAQPILQHMLIIRNRNAENSQVGFRSGHILSFDDAAGSTTTSAEDTSANVDLVMTGHLASSTETITLESYMVELFYQA